jgi:hypothetical protein
MKYLFFIFIPIFSFAQEIKSDTMYLQKEGRNYFIVTEILYVDSTRSITKNLYGDSLQSIERLIYNSEKISNKYAEVAFPFITIGKANKDIRLYNELHQQINGKSIFTSTAQRDEQRFAGSYKLNFNGEIIDGVIELNINKRLIFNPDNGKVYSISTNLLLGTFTNQISFTFNSVKYDLYKYAEGKFATVDGDVRLIKME